MHFVLQHFFSLVLIDAECLNKGQLTDTIISTEKPLQQPQKEVILKDL